MKDEGMWNGRNETYASTEREIYIYSLGSIAAFIPS